MKTAVLIITSLLASYPFLAAADAVEEGPFELTEAGMDAITAGSVSGPPSAAVAAFSDAMGDFVITGTSASSYVQNSPTALQFGSAAAWIAAMRGTASATSSGGTSSRSTDVNSTADPSAPNPYGGTINYTRNVLGTEISVFAEVRPGGHLLDFWHAQVNGL